MYFTLATLRDSLGETRFMGLVDNDHDGVVGDADEKRALKAIRRSSSEIDSRIGSKYPTPLAPENVTEALLSAVEDMIVYRLSDDGDFMTETVEKRHRDAISWAKDVAKGMVQLGVTAIEPSPRIPAARRSGPPKLYGNRAMKDLM